MNRILIKLLALPLVLITVSFLTFAMLDLLPGDTATAVLGPDSLSDEGIAAIREELRLDDPFLVRYADWAVGALRGDLGESVQSGRDVGDLLRQRLPVTAELVALSVVLALAVALPVGLYSAHRFGRLFDAVASVGAATFVAVPSFVVALLLVYVFSIQLGWLPASGWVHLSDDPVENLRTALLPAASLAATQAGLYSRILRASTVATLREDHVRLARSKGLSTRRILAYHALRLSSFPLLTVVGLQTGLLLATSVVVETVFAVPGLGRLLMDGILQRDVPVVQGAVLMVAGSVVLINFVVDALYTVLDPRLRRGPAHAVA